MMNGGPCFILTLLLVIDTITQCQAILGSEDSSPYYRTKSTNNCPSRCYCSGLSIDCSGWNLDNQVLPNATTQLHLKNYPKDTIKVDAFEHMKDIQWLRISPGQLQHLTSWPILPKLSYLDLSANNIKILSEGVLRNLPQLTHLNVSSNKIQVASSNFLKGLHSLRVLDLSNNPLLPELSKEFFSNARDLEYLDLSATNQRDISKTVFDQLPSLYYLNLSKINMRIMPHITNKAIEVLDISKNPILHVALLDQVPNLTKLYAHHTYITKLDPSMVGQCEKLKLIDLSSTNLTNINNGVFENCHMLEELRLSGSYNLWRIEYRAFAGLHKLSKLYLNDCPHLQEMESNVMMEVTTLKELYLQNSGVRVLPITLRNLHNLSFINIDKILVKCDCYNYWLPEWLSEISHTAWKEGSGRINCLDGQQRTIGNLKNHIDSFNCKKVQILSPNDEWVLAPWGQSALLECNVTGTPTPNIIWQTSRRQLLIHGNIKEDKWVSHKIREALAVAHRTADGKFQVLNSGKLLIKEVQREDIGRYKCFAYNAVSNSSAVAFLGLQDTQLRAFIQESLLFGFLCAAVFLFITLFTQFIKYIMDRLGCECCCCKNRLSPKAKQIRQLLESVEAYKSAQLDKLRDNYTSQVVYIKDSCYQQMEKLRDGYAQQSKNLKDLCDYSTQQISGARDQYVDQVNKVRDYSLGQMNRVRENYVFQRQRIRKFSAHQLLRLRETYKYQQKTLNKLLETLPDLYIQNCRTGACQRTDSIIFDEIDGLDVYYKMDFLDNQSLSDCYYTPTSTLTRKSKVHKQGHSRNASGGSAGTEYQEASSWVTRQGSINSETSTQTENKLHGRSLSLAMPAIGVHRSDSLKGHKRSLSASHPAQQTCHPKSPLTQEMSYPVTPKRSTRAPIVREGSGSLESSTEASLYTPSPTPGSPSTFCVNKTIHEDATSKHIGISEKIPSNECIISEIPSLPKESLFKGRNSIAANCDTKTMSETNT